MHIRMLHLVIKTQFIIQVAKRIADSSFILNVMLFLIIPGPPQILYTYLIQHGTTREFCVHFSEMGAELHLALAKISKMDFPGCIFNTPLWVYVWPPLNVT